MTQPSAVVRMSRALSVSGTGKFLRKQIWLWPIVALAVLGGIAVWVHETIEGQMRTMAKNELQTVLNADSKALELWLQSQQATARTLADSGRIEELVRQLVQAAAEHREKMIGLATLPLQKEILDELQPLLALHRFYGFLIVLTPVGKDAPAWILSSDRDEMIGRDGYKTFADLSIWPDVFAGKARISKPYASVVPLVDVDGKMRPGVPTMLVAAPVMDPADPKKVLAGIAFRLRPQEEFSEILAVARCGETGEAYAFDSNGFFLSRSRFDEQLKTIRLLPDQPEVTSALRLELRNPGIDLTKGGEPKLRRSEQPLTWSGEQGRKKQDGINVDGYPDYRGVPTIGAVRWLPEHDFGIAAEVDYAEAYRPLSVLHLVFRGLFVVLGAAALAIWGGLWYMNRLREKLRAAAVESKQLGQYTLEEKLGQGGMGVVYRARHALLRRPTAVKLLHVGTENQGAVARFEREVQLTSQLTHPNTVAVYDFGRTPEGLFYYAMEYLNGLSLDQLVRQFGPLPEGRAIHILRQVCGSLTEAHEACLVHRDIKPANILINSRGGVFDLVKVLDFGLVKAMQGGNDVSLTAANSLTGTPQYLSPEGVQNPEQVDARSDLYAVGAVGYFLVTGTPVFRGENVIEVCMQQVAAVPEPPSRRLGTPLSPEFEGLILQCLAKKREDRPQNARTLARALAACPSAATWTDELAQAWWTEHHPQPLPEPVPHAPGTSNSGGGARMVSGSNVLGGPAGSSGSLGNMDGPGRSTAQSGTEITLVTQPKRGDAE